MIKSLDEDRMSAGSIIAGCGLRGLLAGCLVYVYNLRRSPMNRARDIFAHLFPSSFFLSFFFLFLFLPFCHRDRSTVFFSVVLPRSLLPSSLLSSRKPGNLSAKSRAINCTSQHQGLSLVRCVRCVENLASTSTVPCYQSTVRPPSFGKSFPFDVSRFRRIRRSWPNPAEFRPRRGSCVES